MSTEKKNATLLEFSSQGKRGKREMAVLHLIEREKIDL